MKGSIALEGLEFFAYHGFYPEERKVGNKYLLDVQVNLKSVDGWHLDELEQTVDYEKIYQIAKAIMEVPQMLLEKLAHDLVTQIKSLSQDIETVTVKVSKANPPIGAVCSYSTITLEG